MLLLQTLILSIVYVEDLLQISTLLKEKTQRLISINQELKKSLGEKENEILTLQQHVAKLNETLNQQKEKYELTLTEKENKSKSVESTRSLIEQLVTEVDKCIEMLEK